MLPYRLLPITINLTIALMSPSLGARMDRTNRLTAMVLVTMTQNLCTVLCAASFLYLLYTGRGKYLPSLSTLGGYIHTYIYTYIHTYPHLPTNQPSYLLIVAHSKALFSLHHLNYLPTYLPTCLPTYLGPSYWDWHLLVAIIHLFGGLNNLLYGIANVLLERDWIIIIADEDGTWLRKMTSNLKATDLSCDLFAPFLVSLLQGVSNQLIALVLR